MTPERQKTVDNIRENVPQELLALGQWVLWRRVLRDGKPTKTPYTVAGGRASSTEPRTWADFETVADVYLRGDYDGIGLVFSESDPYCGIDFDHHAEDGVLDDWALERVNRLDAYTEFSPSGAGVHVIVRGRLPDGKGRKPTGLGVEIYDRGRFFTMTGNALDGRNWLTVPDRQDAVDWLLSQLPQTTQAQAAPAQPVALDDAALLERMFSSKHGDAIRKLWSGFASDYADDDSAADLALCNHLAFWTSGDAERIDRLFRQSALFRDKWDRNARSGETYGAGTISRAIAGTPERYQAGAAGHSPQISVGDDVKMSDRIDRDLRAWGYDLWLNDMDESVWNGSERMNDADRAVLRMTARDAGYAKERLLSALDDAIVALATRRRRHPVQDYLNATQWDGSDHIAHLASYFDDAHEPVAYSDGTRRTVFHAFLRRWLVSSIAKMFGDERAARANFVLVLAGAQNAGKSHFAGWLCPLPGYFVEKHVQPDDKDCSLQRTRAWVWEIMELGATTGRANVEALKAHITAATVTERKAYGHFDTVRPAIASYIGTVNPDGGGFLTDQTGNRRFAVVDVEHINWRYAERIDVNQVWAQAMQLWRSDPDGYRFAAEEWTVQRANADAHMAPDIFADMLVRTFHIDAKQTAWRSTSSEILDTLRTYAGMSRGNDKAQGKELARTLRREFGIVGKRTNGATVYSGLQSKANPHGGD